MTDTPTPTPRRRPSRAPRNPMPEQPANVRRHNFGEVTLGYTLELARAEAQRCLQCKNPTCEQGCPVGVYIKDFIAAIIEDDLCRAVAVLKERNALPAVCGRVCPQESQCEKTCVLAKRGEAVAIGRLERFLADWDRNLDPSERNATPHAPKKDLCVAVVGSGPSSLACAGELSLRGYRVEVFEALHTAGGVLAYGIPEFRLPKAILEDEINSLRRARVKFRFNEFVGKITSAEELLTQGYSAVYLGLGAGLPRFMNIPGENHNGVYSANEFLTRVNLMHAYEFPAYDTPLWRGHSVVVVGGGNVAMDAARTALRLGAEKVTLAYRRTQTEMPARAEEVHHAQEEGVQIVELVAPLEIEGSEGWVTALHVQHMELGDPDESGRRRPVAVEGKTLRLECDTVITAIGTRAHPHLFEVADIQVDGRGYIKTDEAGRTSNPRIFAGGDIVTGAATVILAMGAGKTAAETIDQTLT